MSNTVSIRVCIFDDVLHARGERFDLPGLEVTVHPHADDPVPAVEGAAVVAMDFHMGEGHLDGAAAVTKLRAAGFKGRIVATSSDPKRNGEMLAAGADEALQQKAMLRSFLVSLSKPRAGSVG